MTTDKKIYPVQKLLCSDCDKIYNAALHTSCPYCTPGIINPLGR